MDPRTLAVFGKDIPFKTEDIMTEGGDIELLLGMCCPDLHQQISLYSSKSGLSIMETRFGPTLVGVAPEELNGNYECSVFNLNFSSITEEKDLWKFCEAETAGIKEARLNEEFTDEELLFEKRIETAWSVDESGQFVVSLPWKIDPGTLPNNRIQAENRSTLLEKQLSKKQDVKKLVDEQIEEMVSNGILRQTDPTYPKRYVPLIAVIDLDRESSRVRVCLDAKAKYHGASLNDALLKGNLKMNDIYQVITRFRSGKDGLLGDIRKMFWQIKISEEDQKFHGVIHNKKTYVFTRICFGDKPSPPIAERSMIKIALHGKETHSAASSVLIHKRYMDDITDANNDEKRLNETREQIDDLIGQFVFEIKCWYSNNPTVGCDSGERKVLGVKWDLKEDQLLPSINIPKCNVTSRRQIAEVWDPLGIYSGLLLTAKLVFQAVVRLQYTWDGVITNEDLLNNWKKWLHESQNCIEISVPRSVMPSKEYLQENDIRTCWIL